MAQPLWAPSPLLGCPHRKKNFSLDPSFSQPPALHPCDNPGSIFPTAPCRNEVATLSPFFSSLNKAWSLCLTSQGKCYVP